MRIFVSEYLCSGAWPEPELSPSLVREGRAMLLALLADLAALPGLSVCTTWDARLGQFPLGDAVACGSPLNVESVATRNPRDERAAFRRLAAGCDASYVIAPEIDDLLTQRVQAVLDARGRCLNATPAAIAACSDKWETFRRLSAAGIPTVPSARFDPASHAVPFDFPVVLKPRFGAGATDTFVVHNHVELRAAASHFPADRPTTEAIVQPYIAGQPLSFAAIFNPDGTLTELWPVCEQRVANDGRLRYRGGRTQWPDVPPLTAIISNFGFRISDSFPGLSGYVGFDLVLPPDGNTRPLIVDINPRLTTSYLGYRALSCVNLAGRILWPDRNWPALDWRREIVDFAPDGGIIRSTAPCD